MPTQFDVWFATNRNRLEKDEAPWYGPSFNAQGSELYRVGRARVVPDGEAYRTKSVTTFPEKPGEAGTDAKAKLGSSRLFSDLKAKMRDEGRDLIVLIHGYASEFATALERAAELTDKYRVVGKDGVERPPLVLAFSWPANGETIPFTSYVSDRQDAAKSGQAIGRLFFRLTDWFLGEAQAERAAGSADERAAHAPCAGRIHLVAHSMGNWALRAAVLSVIERRGGDRLPAIFDNVFLMAADEDEDALQDPRKLGLLPRLANAVHVYHSKDDQALVISDVTKLNPDRLGQNGPSDMDRTDPKVVAVDCRHVDRTSFAHANHQYYRLDPTVIADVRQVLAGKVPGAVPGRVPLEHRRRWLIQPPETAQDREPFGGRGAGNET